MRIKNNTAKAVSARRSAKAVADAKAVKADAPKARVAKIAKPKASNAQAKATGRKAVAIKADTARVADALSNVASAGFAFARGQADVVALLKVTGASKAARARFIIGYMAQRLNPALRELTPAILTKAETAFKAKGKDSKGKVAKGQARRTDEQERAYGAARKAWHIVTKKADVAATDNRGGANNKGKVKTGANKPDADTAKPEAVPAVINRETAMAYAAQQAVALLAFANKHAKVMPLDYAVAIRAFHKAVVAIKGDKA